MDSGTATPRYFKIVGARSIIRARCLCRARAIHEQNTGNRFRIHNVVSTPAAHVVFQHGMRKAAHRALPGNPESTMKIYQQIRRILHKRTRV